MDKLNLIENLFSQELLLFKFCMILRYFMFATPVYFTNSDMDIDETDDHHFILNLEVEALLLESLFS